MIPFNNLVIDKNLREELDKEIGAVLDSHHFILGKKVESFEKNFANFIGTKYACGIATGTDAIRLSLRTLGVKRGDKVLTVAFTSPFTALAIAAEGAVPVFCDIDEDTWTIDVSDAKKKIDSKVKAIIPVHIYGNPCNMKAILNLAQEANIKVVEDACQAHGASIDGKKVGAFGDAGAFSFYPTKNLGAFGDAGAITTSNGKIYELIMSLRNGGQTKRFWHTYEGTNSRLDEIQAAVLGLKLKHLEETNKKREWIVNRYKDNLVGLPIKFQALLPGAKHANHIFAIGTHKRNALKMFLESHGVQCDIYYPWPLHKLPLFRKFLTSALPVTEKVSGQILALPLYPTLGSEDQEKVIRTVRQFFGK